MHRLLLVAVFIGAGCAEPIPAQPTWFGDVQPLLLANCGRCHGADPAEARLGAFRLDRYVQADDATLDAWDYRDAILSSAVERNEPVMPPTHALTERQRELLSRWHREGAPKGTRENQPPQAVLVSPTVAPEVVDQSLEVELRSWDDDGDGLWTELAAREVGGTEEHPLSPRLGQGLRRATLDTGTLASARTYELLAIVDDGHSDLPEENRTVVPLTTFQVDHGARGTAPSIRLLRPNGGDTLFGAVEIAWTASDPDPGDTWTVDLELYRLSGDALQLVETIASGLAQAAQSHTWTPDVPAQGAGGEAIYYLVRARVTDAFGNTRADDSDAPFTLAPPATVTQYGWEDVRPIFATYCLECHGQPAKTAALEDFRLDKYDASDPAAPANGDLGVYEMRGDVYQRMIVSQNMPPAAEPQPSGAELALVQDWLLGGAPRGGGPTDAPPSFSWNTPNDSAITRTTTGTVTLNWTVSDPEGQPLASGKIFVAELSAPADQQAHCGAGTTGWTEVTGMDITAGSAPWTAPKLGYFCFKAEVEDAAAQRTVRIAARPVKYAAR